MRKVIEFSHDLFGGKHPLVEDMVISARAEEYLIKHFGRCVTNCSTLARYLFDGNFVECSEANGYFTFDSNFTIYTGQELYIGDIIMFMFNKSMAKSNDGTLLQYFISLVKNAMIPINGYGELSSEQIREGYARTSHFTDFHLMTHVGGIGTSTAFLNQTSINKPNSIGEHGDWNQGRIVICLEDPVNFLKYPVVPLLLRRNNEQ